MSETALPETDHLLKIAAAARDFVKLVDEPHDGPGYEFRRQQQAAYDRLVAVVKESRDLEEAIHATDS